MGSLVDVTGKPIGESKRILTADEYHDQGINIIQQFLNDGYSLETVQRLVLRNIAWESIGYKPHDKQLAIHTAIEKGAKKVLANCGKRWGKSRCAAAVGYEEMLYGAKGGLAKNMIMIAAPESDITEKIFQYVWKWTVEDNCLNKALGLMGYNEVGDLISGKSYTDHRVETIWHSKCQGRTTEKPNSLMGEGTSWYFVDEASRIKNRVIAPFIMPNLLDNDGGLMITSTPDGFDNEYYEMYEDWTEKAITNPRYFTINSTTYDNTYLTPANIKELEDYYKSLPGGHEMWRQEIMAEFVSQYGIIYKDFQPTKNGKPWHVDRRVQYNRKLPLTAFVDWGTRNPFAALLVQIHGDGEEVEVLEEFEEVGLTPDRQVKVLLDWQIKYGTRIDWVCSDPSNKGMRLHSRSKGLKVWMWGSRCDKKILLNNVEAGINLTSSLFAYELKPLIRIHPSCVKLIRALRTYRYNEGQNEEPKKVNDHLPDALRYGNMARIVVPEMSRREEHKVRWLN